MCSSDLIAVWVGYDNAKGKRTLGAGQAGSRVALPIFDSVMQSVWAMVTPQTALVGPSREASRQLIALPIDANSGQRIEGSSTRGAFTEYFKLDSSGRFLETQYRLVSRGHEYSVGDDQFSPSFPRSSPFGGNPWFSSGRDYDGSPLIRQRRDRKSTRLNSSH